nr:LysE family translocator [uncultured Cohaesibacter sp.]
MTLSSLLLFAGALFLAAGSPGPSIAALVARVMSRGAGDVLPFLAAMWIGEAIWLSFAVAGLTVIAASYQPLFAAIKWAGCLYLLYLAYKMWTSDAPDREEGALPESRSALGMFFTGLAVTMGNPKIMLFYAALLPTLIDLNAVTMLGWIELLAVMLVTLAVVDIGWVLLADKARRLFRSPKAVSIVNKTGAAAMAAAAAAIANKA